MKPSLSLRKYRKYNVLFNKRDVKNKKYANEMGKFVENFDPSNVLFKSFFDPNRLYFVIYDFFLDSFK
jgi:hypothetical protein